MGWSVRSLSVMVPLFGRLWVDFPYWFVVLGLLFQQVWSCVGLWWGHGWSTIGYWIQYKKVWNSFLRLLFGLWQILRMGSWMVYNRLRSIAVWRQYFLINLFHEGRRFAFCRLLLRYLHLRGGGVAELFPPIFLLVIYSCIGDSLVCSLVSLGFHC